MNSTESFKNVSEPKHAERSAQLIDDSRTQSKLDVFKSAAAQLKKDLQKQQPFAEGTIVRWTSVAAAGQQFHYAAIFAIGNWYTTAKSDTTHIQRVMSHEDFLAYLNSHGYSVTNLAVAVDFETVEL